MSLSTSTHKRERLFVNPDIQGGLIIRTTIHWGVYMVAVLFTVAIWTAFSNQQASITTLAQNVFSNFAPALIAGVVLLPLFLYDQLKFSNRMVGPIYRMRREMRKLARGEGVQKLRFRDRDHWPDLADEFNRLAEVVIHTRRSLRTTEEKSEEIAAKTFANANRKQLQRHEMKLHRR